MTTTSSNKIFTRGITLTSLSSPDAFDAYVCNGCKRRMTINDFSKGELKQSYENRRCRTCFNRTRTSLLIDEENTINQKERELHKFDNRNEFGVSKEMEDSFRRDLVRYLGDEGLLPESSSSSSTVTIPTSSQGTNTVTSTSTANSSQSPVLFTAFINKKNPITPVLQAIEDGLFNATIKAIHNDPKSIHKPDSNTGRNPLHNILTSTKYTIEAKYHIISDLLEYGLDPNAGTFLGRERPLHFAVALDNRRIITLLINYGALPTLTNRLGRSPLYYVQSIDIARLLIQQGATEDIKDKYGMTLCDYADEIKNKQMARFWNRRNERKLRLQESKRKQSELTIEEKLYLEQLRIKNQQLRESEKLQNTIDAAGKAYMEWKTGGTITEPNKKKGLQLLNQEIINEDDDNDEDFDPGMD